MKEPIQSLFIIPRQAYIRYNYIVYISNRILKVNLNLNQTVLHLISVYDPKAKGRIRITKYGRKSSNEKQKMVLLGDFNARIENIQILGLKQRFNEDTVNENGELLIELCPRNELRINNIVFPHKEQHKFTLNNAREQK